MKIERYKGKTIKYYESIEEMPITSYHKFQKYLLLEAQVGDDLNGLREHLEKIGAFIRESKSDQAAKELTNVISQIQIIDQEISFKSLAFAAIVHSIDGKKYNARTDEDIKRISQEINMTVGFISKLLEAVKKKLETKLPYILTV